jgi:pimeloyl-ACP methyl ester carboxylesterase
MEHLPDSSTHPYDKGYSAVNGINMYYERYGAGKALVLIHGGGSTIQTTFGTIIPMLVKHRDVIAIELQAHGRTSDRNQDSSFEQDADDVAGLLKNLKIHKADIFGFSNGGTTAVQIAIRYPALVGKLVLASTLCKRDGVSPGFWDFMNEASLENMPQQLQDAFLAVMPDAKKLKRMHDRDAKRMVNFKNIPDEAIRAIKLPALIIQGDKDVIKPEHALEMFRNMEFAELAIIPGLHGEYIGELTTLDSGSNQAQLVVPLILHFLDK